MTKNFSFCVMRPHPSPRKKGFFQTEWLHGGVDKDEAESEALALLNDPRDTIVGVYLWSDRWNQFAGKWKREAV